MNFDSPTFWSDWENLIQTRGYILDRPKGSRHPRYPDDVYPLDYGYIPDTAGGDGAEVDIYVGSEQCGLTAVLHTFDRLKDDEEIKLLWNCSEEEIQTALRVSNVGTMSATLIRRPIYEP